MQSIDRLIIKTRLNLFGGEAAPGAAPAPAGDGGAPAEAAAETDAAPGNGAAEEAGDRLSAQRELQRRAGERLEQWTREGEALRTKYPAFDLRAEARDPLFTAMLRAGAPMERAFCAVHADEILSGAIRQTAALTERRVVENIRAKGQRPAEAGLGAQSGVVVRSDVSRLTRADRAELARRAMHGESISF